MGFSGVISVGEMGFSGSISVGEMGFSGGWWGLVEVYT